MQIATPNGSLDAPCGSQNAKKGILSRIPFFILFRKIRRPLSYRALWMIRQNTIALQEKISDRNENTE